MPCFLLSMVLPCAVVIYLSVHLVSLLYSPISLKHCLCPLVLPHGPDPQYATFIYLFIYCPCSVQIGHSFVLPFAPLHFPLAYHLCAPWWPLLYNHLSQAQSVSSNDIPHLSIILHLTTWPFSLYLSFLLIISNVLFGLLHLPGRILLALFCQFWFVVTAFLVPFTFPGSQFCPYTCLFVFGP